LGSRRGRQIRELETIQTVVPVFYRGFGNFFWQTVYPNDDLATDAEAPWPADASFDFGGKAGDPVEIEKVSCAPFKPPYPW
jgi:hypothetical protein